MVLAGQGTLKYWSAWCLIAVSMTAAVIFLSLTSKLPEGGVNHLDKFNHWIAYLALTLAWLGLGFRAGMVVLLLFLLGGSLEVLQGLGGNRAMSWADQLANCLGLLTGLVLWSWKLNIWQTLERLIANIFAQKF